MFKKTISFFEPAAAEKAKYEKIKSAGLETDGRFSNKTGRKIFDLTLTYPVQDAGFIGRLISVQKEIGYVLGDSFISKPRHFYASDRDFHLSLLNVAERSPLLSERNRVSARGRGVDLFFNEDDLIIKPRLHFWGGSAGQDAVIIHGYNFQALNVSRVALARYGLRHKLFDYDKGLGYALSLMDGQDDILKYERVDPDIAQISLLRFGRQITLPQRMEINNLLENRDFGEVVFPEIGLYELERYGVFSSGTRLANRIFPEASP